MSYLHRLILVFLFFCSSSVFAFPATSTNSTCDASGSCYSFSISGYFPTASAQATCTAWATQPAYASSAFTPVLIGLDCYAQNSKGLNAASATITKKLVTSASYICPTGATLSGASCSCNSPTVENSSHDGCSQPAAPPSCPANSTLGSAGSCVCSGALIMNGDGVPGDGSACVTRQDMCDMAAGSAVLYGGSNATEVQIAHSSAEDRPQAGFFVCSPTTGFPAGQGCTAEWQTSSLSVSYQKSDGSGWLSYGYAVRTPHITLPCNGNADAKKNVPIGQPVTCKGGQQGQVNGKTVCIPFLPSTPTVSVRSGETNQNDANGNPVKVEKDVSTICVNSTCTTTTTTNTTSSVTVGGVLQTNTSTDKSTASESKADYCTKNPRLTECGQSGNGGSSFGGSCEAGFVCDGDGLTCAMAKEQYRINCKLYEDDKDAASLFNKSVDGTDESSTDALKEKAETVNISSFDSTGLGWSRSCPADPVIPLAFGRTQFSIPFSRICGPLGILSVAGVGITLLGSMLWVLGSKKS